MQCVAASVRIKLENYQTLESFIAQLVLEMLIKLHKSARSVLLTCCKCHTESSTTCSWHLDAELQVGLVKEGRNVSSPAWSAELNVQTLFSGSALNPHSHLFTSTSISMCATPPGMQTLANTQCAKNAHGPRSGLSPAGLLRSLQQTHFSRRTEMRLLGTTQRTTSTTAARKRTCSSSNPEPIPHQPS